MKTLSLQHLKTAWLSLAVAALCLPAQAASTVVRTISNDHSANPGVSITATPDSSVSVYAVEDDLPAGLTPANIDNSGAYDSVNHKVKWGPFFDNTARTLSYTVSGSPGVYTISGVGSFDGTDVPATGDSTLTIGYTAAVSASPSGGGAVSGGGTFASGSSVTVTATANAGYQFVNWTEGTTVASTSASYNFTLSADRTLVANFTPIYTVAVSAAPSAGGTVSGGGTFASGSSVTVTAAANAGYQFVNWTEGGTAVSPSASYTFTLNADRTLVANFTPVYTVAVSALPSAGGTASGGGSFTSGSSVTVTANASANYQFVNWTEGGTEVSTSASYTFTLGGDRTLVANFTQIMYTVGVSASPSADGTVNGGGTFASGSSVTVTATPSTGYHFANWTEGGTVVSSDASYAFTLSGNRTLVANFAQTTYTVAVSASPSAGGTVSGGGTFASGSPVTVTATANTGYQFVNWTEGGTVVSTSANYTITSLSGDRTLVANFTPLYTVAVSASPSAGGTVSGGGTFTSGTSVTVTAAANTGYQFVNWTEGGTAVSSSASYIFTLSGDRTLVANFTPVYTVAVSASPTAGGTVSGGGSFTSGSSVTVTATANAGYQFVKWMEGTTVVSTSASYTFTLSGDRTLVANFTPLYTVAVSASPSAGGTASGGGTFASGSSVSVTASPKSGYQFINWTEGTTVVSSSANYTITSLESDRTLVANFDQPPTISHVADQTMFENRTLSISFLVSDAETPVANLIVTATSSNHSLVPDSGIVPSGSGTIRTAGVTPSADSVGTATVVLTVTDGAGLTASTSFGLTVLPADTAVAGAGQNAVASTAPKTAGQPGVTATLDNSAGTQSATVTVETYNSNPVPNTSFQAGSSYVDVNVQGAASGDSLTALFYYPSTTPDSPTLLYFTGSAWAPVLSSGGAPPALNPGDNLDGTVSGGRLTVVFDNTSTPKIGDLTGTQFAMVSEFTVAVSASPGTEGAVSGGGSFAPGSSVTVTASAKSGYQFVNWTEGGAQVSTSARYTFTLSANRTLVANFAQIRYSVTLSASPLGAGLLSGGGNVLPGTSVTVVANPSAGFQFVNWTEGGAQVSSSASYTFTVTGDRTLVANFTRLSYTVALSASPSAGGTVSGGGTFASTSSVTVVASPNTGYQFANWTENGTVVSASAGYTFILNGDRTLVANFNSVTPVTNTVVVSASPSAGGIVSGGGNFAPGSSVTVTAGPSTDYQFVNWTEAGAVVSTNASYTFTLSADRTLVANFEQTAASISGNIHTSSGAPLAGILMSGLPGNPMTDTNGNYTAQVPMGWSGTTTPAAAGYNVDPPSRSYNNVSTNQAGQDFVATRLTVGIWGSVRTSSGTPLAGVVLSGLPGSLTTDTNGDYQAQVPWGWSGTVTPTATGYTFNPGSLGFTNVTVTWIGQNFVATPTVTLGLVPQGAGGQFQLSVSAPSGQALMLQTSSDLAHWQDWKSVVATGGQDTYLDAPPPGTNQRFYRAVVQ